MPPAVVAHRGASALRPEHTLAAYELAVEQGADGLECDVRLTRDGHLVCVHDRTVARTSDGAGVVSELSLAQLAELDFGSWHAGAAAPSAVLTLDALLGLAADTGTRLFVETKHPVRYGGLVERRLLDALARFGLGDRVAVLSFAVTALRRISLGAPALPTVLLCDGAGARRRLPPWVSVAGPSLATLRADPGYVARCGRDVYVWTVDEPADVTRCAELGVAYLATNHPDTSRDALGY